MNLDNSKTVPFEGIGFNAAVVASMPVDKWVTQASKQYWPNLTDAERAAKLKQVHKQCTDAVKPAPASEAPAK